MKILSFDTCGDFCSVALSDQQQLIDYQIIKEPLKQAEQLVLMIQSILANNNYLYSQLAAIALNVGPGSFTGIRVGIAAALGFKLASKIKLVGLNAFEILINNVIYYCQPTVPIVVLFDARSQYLYYQSFNCQLVAQTKPLLLYKDQLMEYLPNEHFVLLGDKSLIDHLKDINFTSIKELTTINASLIAKAVDHQNIAKYQNKVEALYIKEASVKIKPA